jgi:four helix bundle protein
MSYGYRDLIVWQKSMVLAQEVYRATKRFPQEEQYGLTSQMRRAAVSIASNVAEGQGRLTKGEFRQFLGQARGSLLELQTQAELACHLEYLSQVDLDSLSHLSEEVRHMLNALISKLAT